MAMRSRFTRRPLWQPSPPPQKPHQKWCEGQLTFAWLQDAGGEVITTTLAGQQTASTSRSTEARGAKP
ncbi:MAG: hypothetical protein EBT03_12185 [Betaproteobacteria bacterium]|nr:hypothetical protein [Betaproteobacteria bacterium]